MFAYAVIVLGWALKLMPWTVLVSLSAIPLAWRAAAELREHHATGSGAKLMPAMASTIGTHLLTGVLLSCGYVAGGMLG